MLGVIDLVVWVVDPQKYADNLIHNEYLARLRRYRDITVVVLNQADLLSPADAHRCVLDLRRLLDADAPGGLNQLRTLLERTVAARQAALYRLAGDVSGVVTELAPLVAAEPDADPVDRAEIEALTDALVAAAGVPAVAVAAERAYLHRAGRTMGWPVLRWLRRLRPDPLRRLHITPRPAADQPVAATSVPPPSSAERAMVAAARSRLDDLTDALDVALASTDLGLSRVPLWWRLFGLLQWLATLTALVGLGWLGVRFVLFAPGMPAMPGTTPALLLLGGAVAGILIAILVRPLVRMAARRVRVRAERRLRSAIAAVAQDLVVTPVRQVLDGYAEARAALGAATGRG